ncbi:MAG: transporter substrate-binding domain-containing protein, partial [Pseudomonas caspiana]
MKLTRLFVRPAAMVVLGAAVAMASSMASAFQQPGKIIAGSDMTFYPYEYMDNNRPAGFDIEFLDGLAKVMGMKA